MKQLNLPLPVATNILAALFLREPTTIRKREEIDNSLLYSTISSLHYRFPSTGTSLLATTTVICANCFRVHTTSVRTYTNYCQICPECHPEPILNETTDWEPKYILSTIIESLPTDIQQSIHNRILQILKFPIDNQPHS